MLEGKNKVASIHFPASLMGPNACLSFFYIQSFEIEW